MGGMKKCVRRGKWCVGGMKKCVRRGKWCVGRSGVGGWWCEFCNPLQLKKAGPFGAKTFC